VRIGGCIFDVARLGAAAEDPADNMPSSHVGDVNYGLWAYQPAVGATSLLVLATLKWSCDCSARNPLWVVLQSHANLVVTTAVNVSAYSIADTKLSEQGEGIPRLKTAQTMGRR
jgi:hypothetical protein